MAISGELAFSTNDARNFSRLGQQPSAAPWPVLSHTIFPTDRGQQQIYPTALRVQDDGAIVVHASVASVPHNYGYNSSKGDFACVGCSGISTYLLREDGFVGLSLAPEAATASLRTRTLGWLGGAISLNVDCSGVDPTSGRARVGGRVRVRVVGSGSGLEEWSAWFSGNSTRWLPEGQEGHSTRGEQRQMQVVVEVEMEREGTRGRGSRGRVCHYVPISTERAQSYIRP